MPQSDQSLLSRAYNNLKSAQDHHATELEEYLPFINTLLRDIREFQTLPKYTLRRLSLVEMNKKETKENLERFRSILQKLRQTLGDDYLKRIEGRVKDFRSEIIIAVENIKENLQ